MEGLGKRAGIRRITNKGMEGLGIQGLGKWAGIRRLRIK
jgi:hypothetical protein